ncbi:MAG: 16S rRNA (cytosine(1402)-N(4))-methyltransferase RsmH [Xanthomonadales bacterium]|nr:16S rRNA (cytosine(1402)-N(4))-methyltransferase RsmH [Gammaproteobacteria bacterium]NNK52412.1 16S rRNA (cytosine(1402)-N(4))-methyltransferase RsmH [Xanthomonadales bacterium]
MGDYQHQPVLREEVLEALNIRPDGKYVDGTFGRGGHSRAILARLSGKGCLLSLDRDPEAIAAGEELQSEDSRFSIVRGNFADLERYVREWGVEEGLDGILLDIGVSSPQLDDPDRGFSFMGDGPLDMRMDPLQGVSAKEWLAEAPERELTRVFWEFGEERYARRIARNIVMSRHKQRLETTGQLARLIEETIGRREKKKHPATRCFQAIRIFINDELTNLKKGLDSAIRLLRPGGRLVVISFHSLEDRLVKRTFREAVRPGKVRRNIPQHPDLKPVLKLVGKAVKASETELSVNPRARSAVMRVAEKLG